MSQMVTVRVPRDAWMLLRETLTLDAHSIVFDKNLRREIEKALQQAEEITPRVLITVRGGVAEYVAADGVDVALVDYDNEPDAKVPEDFRRLAGGVA